MKEKRRFESCSPGDCQAKVSKTVHALANSPHEEHRMEFPKVTLPIDPELVQTTINILHDFIAEKTREAWVAQELLKFIRSTCPHKNVKRDGDMCSECGYTQYNNDPNY